MKQTLSLNKSGSPNSTGSGLIDGRSSRPLVDSRVEILRKRINDENYLYAAIQRMALVLSNELMEISSEGGHHERKRRK